MFDPTTNCQRQIYINEVLSKSLYQLLVTVKNWAKANNYKYAWQSGGKVFIRKDDGLKVLNISNASQLHSIESTSYQSQPQQQPATTSTNFMQQNYELHQNNSQIPSQANSTMNFSANEIIPGISQPQPQNLGNLGSNTFNFSLSQPQNL